MKPSSKDDPIAEALLPHLDAAYNFARYLSRTTRLPKTYTRGVNNALEELSVEYREVIVLREFEDLSYKEIARVTGAPVWTVMPRLARATN